MSIKIYGIKNCDTMKKALKWLETRDIPVEFHDYKKHGADEQILNFAIQNCGWENVINRRGLTWRRLPDNIKNTMNEKSAVKIALENPSIIKRPLLVYNGETHLGFKEETYQRLFQK